MRDVERYVMEYVERCMLAIFDKISDKISECSWPKIPKTQQEADPCPLFECRLKWRNSAAPFPHDVTITFTVSHK